MNIAIASTEFESIIKTGGLGDAIYGISNALSKYDEFNVCVILPNFKNVDDCLRQINKQDNNITSDFILIRGLSIINSDFDFYLQFIFQLFLQNQLPRNFRMK